MANWGSIVHRMANNRRRIRGQSPLPPHVIDDDVNIQVVSKADTCKNCERISNELHDGVYDWAKETCTTLADESKYPTPDRVYLKSINEKLDTIIRLLKEIEYFARTK